MRMIMRTEEEFADGFNCGFDCSMQVLSDLAPEVGLTEEQGLRLAACLGVGAGQGSLCGAVAGALIAIGYRYGNAVSGDMATKGTCMAKRAEFYQRFQEEFGSLTCPGVMGYDLRIPEEAKAAREKGLFTTLCPRACRFAVITAIDIMKE